MKIRKTNQKYKYQKIDFKFNRYAKKKSSINPK